METESQLTQEQQWALNALNGTQNVFLTGEAGAGKSFVIRHFRKSLNDKVFPTLASTGAAAVLVGGRTFHSFFGLGILEGGAAATLERVLGDRRVVRRINKIDGFIVDEVSMLSAEVLAVAEKLCRLIRENEEPWGGLKVVMVGDFAQLPPVTKWGQKRYWAFESRAWLGSGFENIYLTENHRTDESQFLQALNEVRVGQLTESSVEFLNSRVVSHEEATVFGTRLFPKVNQTQQYNLKRLEELSGETKEFDSIFSGPARTVDRLKKVAPLPETIFLKKDCYVMIRVNDPRKRWVNGTTGYVRGFDEDGLEIELETGRTITLEKMTFSLLDADGKVAAAVTNFPISLAYAITIHKAQGLTLSQSYIDLCGLWEPGHAYVALSRSTSSQGLNILRWDQSSIRTDSKVQKFYQSLIERKNQSASTLESHSHTMS